MRLSTARALVEAKLAGDTPALPPPLDKQMPMLLWNLYKCKSSIADRRKQAHSKKAGFAERSLAWAEDGMDTAINAVKGAIPKWSGTTPRNRRAGSRVRPVPSRY